MKLFSIILAIVALSLIGGIGIYTALVAGWWIVAAVAAIGVITLQQQLLDVLGNVATGRKWWK